MLHFLKNILQLIVYPSRGWEDIGYCDETPAQLCRRGLYPLMGVAALSCVGAWWHLGHGDVSLAEVIQRAIVTFVDYFVTLFFAEFAFSLAMPYIDDATPSQQRNSIFIIYCLAVLLLIRIIINVVPVDLAVLHFLPVYAGFMMWKGMPQMHVRPDRQGHFMFLAAGAIIAPPYVLEMLFDIILPSQ